MLVLTRKVREKIKLSNGVIISIEGLNESRVKIGIEAPKEVGIRRSTPCIACGRPSFDYFLDYEDLPYCGHKSCSKKIAEENKSLFD